MNEWYGRISEDELLRAIDSLTVDHGETEIALGREPRAVCRLRRAAKFLDMLDRIE